uniref:histidine kinase n=1 Tax=Desulfovibrio sp. U5L TaxID=596152 RepID=I2Q5A2_9BACT
MHDGGKSRDELLREVGRLRQELAGRAALDSLIAGTLGLIKSEDSTRDLLRAVVILIARETGFAAVGLRLREGEDFPYFMTTGLSEEFIRLENSLCPKGGHGQPARDGDGGPLLECACGMVIQGRLDHSEPFVTDYGSLWVNSNTDLIAERPELLERLRGNCIGSGYESSALIPIRFGTTTHGLLQLEDRRRGLFTLQLVAGLELVARHLALALSQRQAVEELRLAGADLERRVSERTKALGESEAKFRVMANAIPQLAWIAQADGYIFWYNDRWYEYTGTTPEQMEGWGWQRVHDPAALPAVMAKWQASIATGKPFDMVFPLRGADGLFRPFLTRINPLLDSEGRVVQWFGTNTDISEQKRMESELRQREEQLQQSHNALEDRVRERTRELASRNAELENFFYITSHDLQEPLRKVQVFGERLRLEYAEALDAAGKDYLKRMEGAAARMQSLINDLLDYSQVATGANVFAYADLGEIVRQSAEDLDRLVEMTGATVAIEALPGAEVDVVQMRQVFQNLLSNALKYHGRNPPEVRVSGEVLSDQGRETVRISVADNGIGFDPRYKDKVFQPFQRLHGRNAYNGTGIGLAIVRKVVERHKGTVTAESEPGKGARFIVTLPVNRQA